MWKDLRKREVGDIHPITFSNAIRKRRISNLAISDYKEIVSPHYGGVNSLRIDLIENRYLLSGASDGSVSTFDIQKTTDYEGGGLIAKHKPLFVIDKRCNDGHKYAVSSVTWYPVDTGLFVTSSFDDYVKVWDTNSTKVVVDFKMPGKVYGAAMSSIATSHMLIAAGSSDVQVRLCDIASGAFTHTLTGHRDGIMAVEWSASSEWILMTGGCDGAIRFWDIRRAGCFRLLDQRQSQSGRRPPLPKKPTNEGTTITEDMKNSSLTSRCFLARDFGGKRVHPGMFLSHKLATGHFGGVTSLKATEDGMHLLSTGSDSKIHLWDIASGFNIPVCFESTNLQMGKPLQLAVTYDSSVVFVPSIKSIKAFDVWTGKVIQTFGGHYDLTSCCCLNSHDQELYTGSNDRHILVWSPPNATIPEIEDGYRRDMLYSSDQDFWSD